jgi:integrase
VLLDARSRSSHPSVIHFADEAVGSIKKGTRRAAEAVGLPWGVSRGVTFHTIRHSIATLLAALGLPERLRMELMGHSEIRTTQQYTHMAAHSQVEPHEQLAAALPVRDMMLAKPRPAPGRKVRREKRRDAKTDDAKIGPKTRSVARRAKGAA